MLQDERVDETKRMEKLHWMIVWQNVVGEHYLESVASDFINMIAANMPVVLAPAATFAIYAIQAHIRGSQSLDTVKAFTSLAIISLVSHPVSRLLCAVPNVASSLGCFQRIQEFLLAQRPVKNERKPSVSTSSITSDELDRTVTQRNGNDFLLRASAAVVMKDVDISPSLSSPVILRRINLSITIGSITMMTGPVASGKSVLLQAILGEKICDSGIISVQHGPIGYCSQVPWIVHGTIKGLICSSLENASIDEEWYRTVIQACDLSSDILALSDGDRTIVGSRGSTLSGGQKQRLALARALYNRPKIFVLDDVLSSLDKATADIVFDRLFGQAGLFKYMGSTVILVTGNSQSYPELCDDINLGPRDR
jgi:ATP-binding cassette subfamily C (CFTR/MRP) protein 1